MDRMKKITKISLQQNGERYNIFLDEAFFCGVTEETLMKLGLKKGMEVDETDLEAIAEEEGKNRCLSYAIFLLGRQNYFEKVLVEKLQRKEYTENEIEFALGKLKEYRYLDDGRLAESFVKDKKRFAKKGPRFIASALSAKGVERETIQEALEANYSVDEAYENCKELATKKYGYYERKTPDTYQLKGKLYAFLAGRGFQSDVMKRAIEDVIREIENEEME